MYNIDHSGHGKSRIRLPKQLSQKIFETTQVYTKLISDEIVLPTYMTYLHVLMIENANYDFSYRLSIQAL